MDVYACPALDLRVLQMEFMARLPELVGDALRIHFGSSITPVVEDILVKSLVRVMQESLDKSTTMDNEDRMRVVADSTTSTLVNFFAESDGCNLKKIHEFCSRVASHTAGVHDELRKDYLTGVKGTTPASPYLSGTKGVYEYIRETLGVKMHGYENYYGFANGLCVDELSIGENISTIYEVSLSLKHNSEFLTRIFS
jgi:phenylalanine ammonia-lyase